MDKAQTNGWEILTDEEKTALTLSINHGKSTWEAGEIMGKAHYKFLEINMRGQKFFKLFTEYFQQYDKLIPTRTTLSASFKQYISLLIQQRKGLMETIGLIDDEAYKKPKSRDIVVAQGLKNLKDSKITQEHNLYQLIMDFDRWNNFRIIPTHLQEPSAFKRRNKHKLRKLVNLFTSLNPVAIMKLKQLYEVKDVRRVKEYCYLPLITVHDESQTQVIKIPKTVENLRVINNLVLYIFHKQQDAEDFIHILKGYVFKNHKHCRDGQEFWPEFRVLTKNAINYDEIQNITPTRKFVLDNAEVDRETEWFITKKRQREDDYLDQRRNRVINKANKKVL